MSVVAQTTGEIYKNEYAMNKYGRHRRAVIVGVGGPSGGISSSPANAIAYQIRNALRRPPLAPVILYDAAGAKIGTINPLTRERTVEPGATRSTT